MQFTSWGVLPGLAAPEDLHFSDCKYASNGGDASIYLPLTIFELGQSPSHIPRPCGLPDEHARLCVRSGQLKRHAVPGSFSLGTLD